MDVSIDVIRNTIEELCKFENRIAGTKSEREAADYLKGILSGIGFDVTEHEFPVVAWTPLEATINLVSPEEKPIDCALFPNSPDVEHRVFLVGLGSELEDDSIKLPVYGIAEWGESLYTSPNTPYNKAVDKGLDGLIISSPDEGDLLKVRIGIQGKQLQIPIFSVSKETGELLRKKMDRSEVILDIKSTSKRGPSNSYNLEAVLEGSEPDYDIVVSAHYDAWFSGASDNAAPAAIVIEVARHMWNHVQQGGVLRRTVRFLLYGAEECGSERVTFWLNGSRNYVESQENLKQFALVVNLDSIGYDATNFVGTTYELLDFAQSVTTALKQGKRFGHYCPPADGSDHWFFTIGGVPTIYLISWPSHLYHTQKDIPEFLDYESIQAYTDYILHTLIEFCNAKLLPLNILTSMEYARERFNGFSKIEENPFEFQEASDLLKRILKHKEPLEKFTLDIQESGTKDDIAKLNDFLLTTAGKLNRTIRKVGDGHEANYLSSFEFIQEYVKIDSVIRTLEELQFMKVHPRILASTRDDNDNPNKLVDIASLIFEMRKECDNFTRQINEEIEAITNDMKETLTELNDLLT
ncbi:MAG: Zn-dependent exopeptidase M28 [Candidatus Thorarchaeota archaeon]|nr:MAG: Zn-dependent exopeptidase M28 [Candidatus Thorarchaeota archaeon]